MQTCQGRPGLRGAKIGSGDFGAAPSGLRAFAIRPDRRLQRAVDRHFAYGILCIDAPELASMPGRYCKAGF
jgi:hypothetical protein